MASRFLGIALGFLGLSSVACFCCGRGMPEHRHLMVRTWVMAVAGLMLFSLVGYVWQ